MIRASSISTRRRPASGRAPRSSISRSSAPRATCCWRAWCGRRQRIPAEVIAIHGITNADVKNAPEWCDTLRRAARRADWTSHRGLQRHLRPANGQPGLRSLRAGRARRGLGVRDEAVCRLPRELGSRQALVPVPEAGARRPRLWRRARGHRAAADAFACRAVVLGMAATPLPESGSGTSRAARDSHQVFTLPWGCATGDDREPVGASCGSRRTRQSDASVRWAARRRARSWR